MALPLIKRSMEPIITKPPNEHYGGWQKFMCPPQSSSIPKFRGDGQGATDRTPDLVPATTPTNPTVVNRQLLVSINLPIPPGHPSNLTTVTMWIIKDLNAAAP